MSTPRMSQVLSYPVSILILAAPLLDAGMQGGDGPPPSTPPPSPPSEDGNRAPGQSVGAFVGAGAARRSAVDAPVSSAHLSSATAPPARQARIQTEAPASVHTSHMSYQQLARIGLGEGAGPGGDPPVVESTVEPVPAGRVAVVQEIGSLSPAESVVGLREACGMPVSSCGSVDGPIDVPGDLVLDRSPVSVCLDRRLAGSGSASLAGRGSVQGSRCRAQFSLAQ